MPRRAILSVAYPLLRVGSGSAGGAEQILHLLDKGLVEAGYRSIVIAAEGSRISGELIATPAAGDEISDLDRTAAQGIHSRKIKAVLESSPVDLIHFHGLDFLTYRPQAALPRQLATLHLPVSWYPPGLFSQANLTVSFVSRSQAKSCPDEPNAAIVANGIDVENFYSAGSKEEYLLWLGRVCPEKGVEIALRVAHRLNMPLRVAGPVHPFKAHQEYFDQRVKPLLDRERIYLGAVSLSEKADLLASAKCLLLPSLAPETSSLAAMEALSSGTPVIAFPSGALPEIVEHEVTGFIADSEDEMAAAVAHVGSISARACRSRAEERFRARRMVDDYIRLYEQIISVRPVRA